MSTTIQLVKNNLGLPAIFINADLHLGKLIKLTVESVNLWSKLQDGSDKNPFNLCVCKTLNEVGGTLFGQTPVEAIYQITYTENTSQYELKIKNFIYYNKFLQCKAYGDVYGFVSYNQLEVDPVMPSKFYSFSKAVDSNGNLINPKQYNITLEPDDIDKQLNQKAEAIRAEQARAAADSARATAETATPAATSVAETSSSASETPCHAGECCGNCEPKKPIVKPWKRPTTETE